MQPETTYEWRQKLLVEITTPAGSKFGSSVTQINISNSKSFEKGNARLWKQWFGEAIYIKLSKTQHLFVLIGKPIDIAQHSFRDHITSNSTNKIDDIGDYYSALEKLRITVKAEKKHYPQFITFLDINDPLTAKVVEPTNLSSVFGGGYKLHKMTVEITDEPTTIDKLESTLTWLPNNTSIQMKNPAASSGVSEH
ncbi:MAG: hypothetical protein HRU28_18145 [Rhizobiales bacterium]|nr:hypothetical protein [Hyphomicrobiales bacterium]